MTLEHSHDPRDEAARTWAVIARHDEWREAEMEVAHLLGHEPLNRGGVTELHRAGRRVREAAREIMEVARSSAEDGHVGDETDERVNGIADDEDPPALVSGAPELADHEVEL